MTDSAIPYGGVAFGGLLTLKYDDARIGYDNNSDGDIDDAGDDIVWDRASPDYPGASGPRPRPSRTTRPSV